MFKIYAILLIVITPRHSSQLEFEIPRHHRDDQILSQMLSIDRYDLRLRPDAHTVVNVSLTLLSLSTPDESSLTYEVEFLLHLRWNDFRLKYEDRGQHKYLNALKHWDRLWVPDLYFIKHGKVSHKHLHDIIALKIFNNGDVHSTDRHDMQMTCSGQPTVFPFDSVECKFAIESKFITHERHQLELLWSIEEQPISSSLTMSSTNAYLIHNWTKDCTEGQSWRHDYSCISAGLLFTRDKAYYLSVYFVPTMVSVGLTFLSFWLSTEWLAVGRIAINVSSLLALIMIFITFRSNLPVVSNISAINFWEFVSILVVCLANIEFVVVLNVNHSSGGTLVSKRLPEEKALNEDEPNSSQSVGRQTRESNFKPFIQLDRISRIVFPIFYFTFVVIYFITYGFITIKSQIKR